MIEIKNLVKRYGELVALDHLNLKFRRAKFSACSGPMAPERRRRSIAFWLC